MVISSKLTLKFSTSIASEANRSFQKWKFTKIQQNLIPEKTICLRLSPTTLSRGKFQNGERLSDFQKKCQHLSEINTLAKCWQDTLEATFLYCPPHWNWGFFIYLLPSVPSKYISFICSFLSAHQNQGFQILSICWFRETRHFIPLLVSVCPLHQTVTSNVLLLCSCGQNHPKIAFNPTISVLRSFELYEFSRQHHQKLLLHLKHTYSLYIGQKWHQYETPSWQLYQADNITLLRFSSSFQLEGSFSLNIFEVLKRLQENTMGNPLTVVSWVNTEHSPKDVSQTQCCFLCGSYKKGLYFCNLERLKSTIDSIIAFC